MFEKDEKMPASETCDTPMFNVKAGAGNKADMSAVDTLTSSTHFNVIRKLITLIGLVISFFSGDTGLIFRTFPDGTKTVFVEEKASVIVPKYVIDWQCYEKADVLKLMVAGDLLEEYFPDKQTRGLRLSDKFDTHKYSRYVSNFINDLEFISLPFIFSKEGIRLSENTWRQFKKRH